MRLSDETVRALEDGRVRGDVELVPGRLRLFAVDRWTRWGAALRFGLSTDGNWVTDTILAARTDDGWQELSSGGASGSRWELPWKRPGHGQSLDLLWKGDPLLCLSTVHLVVYDADEQENFLEAVCGFALPLVSAIRVEWDVETHDAPVAPPSHPFVALAGGTGAYTLTPLDADAAPVGEPRRRWR